MPCVPPSSNFDQDDSQDLGTVESLSSCDSGRFAEDRGSGPNYVHGGNTQMMEPPMDFSAVGTSANTSQGPLTYSQNNYENYQFSAMNAQSIPSAQQPYPTQQHYATGPASVATMRADADDSWVSSDVERDLSDVLHDLKIDPVGVGMLKGLLAVGH